jgi:hypothetical protein
LALSIAGGTAVTAFLVFAMGSWGYSLWFGVPFAAGCVLGYRAKAHVFVLPLLGLIVLLGLIFGFASLNLAGVFCGLTLGGILAGPLVVGIVTGAMLRQSLKLTRFSQREYLPVLLFFLLPVASAAVEGRPRPQPPESISTSQVIGASPARAWDAVVFYEEVRHLPPWILRIGLAHPLYTIGQSRHVGDVKTCVYNKGHITKRITEAEPGRLLAFDVIEQDIGYGRDVRLIGGSFWFEPSGEAGTRVTLTTTYEPLLTPRWCWRPFEALAVHTLHGHVLNGMRLNCAGEESPRAKEAP